MEKHERAGTTDSDEFKSKPLAFTMTEHVCRLDPKPRSFLESAEGFGRDVYNVMWGPNEFTCLGSLRQFERMERLHEIRGADSIPVRPVRRGDARNSGALSQEHAGLPDARIRMLVPHAPARAARRVPGRHARIPERPLALSASHSSTATRHLPLATRHLPLATRHLPLAPWPLATRYLPPATRYLLLEKTEWT